LIYREARIDWIIETHQEDVVIESDCFRVKGAKPDIWNLVVIRNENLHVNTHLEIPEALSLPAECSMAVSYRL
jgi:hypothetical protein